MNKPDVAKIIKNTQTALTKRSPEILTGLGLVGMATTIVLAVKATPKALKLKEVAEQEKGEKLTAVETVKTCWKPYVPVVISGTASAACVIGAHSVHAGRNAALVTAYKLSETAFSEYKESVIKTVGEKKEKTVKENVAKAKVEKNPVTNSEVIITGKGKSLCMDAFTQRYFESDLDAIRREMVNINRNIVVDMYASLNDFYDAIGLHTIPIGDKMGWNIDDGEIEIEVDTTIADDGRPCLVIGFNKTPDYDFNRFA